MPLTSVKQAMDEYQSGDLHSGKGGPVVKSRKQAIAIGLSSARRAGTAKGKSARPPSPAKGRR